MPSGDERASTEDRRAFGQDRLTRNLLVSSSFPRSAWGTQVTDALRPTQRRRASFCPFPRGAWERELRNQLVNRPLCRISDRHFAAGQVELTLGVDANGSQHRVEQMAVV